MISSLLTGVDKNDTPGMQTYRLEFPSINFLVQSPVLFSEEEIWKQLLNLQNFSVVKESQLVDPIAFGKFLIEKKGYEFLISKLSGLKRLESGKEMPFIYTKLTSNYFSVIQLDKLLNLDQIKEFVHYALSNRLFSYQMLYTLFNLLESKIPVASLVSKRVYQTFLEDIEPFKEQTPNDRNWEMLVVFISNYHFSEFLKEKKILPDFEKFLEGMRRRVISRDFSAGQLSKLIRRQIDPKKMVSFFGTIPDDWISSSFDRLEWETFKPHVSHGTYERIQNDIDDFYEKEKSWEFKIQILRKLIDFIVKNSPDFYFFNRSFELKTTLNLIFDRVTPIYMALALKSLPELQKNVLPYLTAFRQTFIKNLIEGKIKKRGEISSQERQTALYRLNFYLAAAFVLNDCWFLLD